MAAPKIKSNASKKKRGELESSLRDFSTTKKRRMRKAKPGDAKRIASAKRRYRGMKYTR